jgi:hypothetical protein
VPSRKRASFAALAAAATVVAGTAVALATGVGVPAA